MSDPKERHLELTVKTAGGSERTIRKTASPAIATDKCMNCGECIKNCPTQAIAEMQRQICRLCPDCAEGDIMFPRDMEALTHRSCSLGCPLGHYPQGYLALVSKGDWEGAWTVIDSVNPLPGVLGRICGRACEEECKRGILIDKDKPMNIRATKRAVADWAFENGKAGKRKYLRNIDKRIAVIGAGPAGITAASDLAKIGYKVTIFEKTSALGGMVRRVVPKFRLPDEIWQREFEMAIGDGIDVKYGVSIGRGLSLEQLFEDGFKAIVLAIGAPNGIKLNIPGKAYKGVYDALSYMNNVKYGIPVETGENTVVIGGGSVATDAARTALRQGAKKVTMVFIESEDEMPALSWEVEEALEEGVEILAGYAPLSIGSQWMYAETIKLAKVTKIVKTESGQLRPEIDESDTTELSADTVIFAVGQAFDRAALDEMGLARNETGGIVMDTNTMSTSLPGVFAAGDLTGGRCSVVDAMASARKAARGADAYLSGNASIAEEKQLGSAPLSEKVFPVRLEKLSPVKLHTLSASEALSSYDEVQADAQSGELQTDARRCIKCGYVKIDHEICIGCGMCARVCPAGDVITMGTPLTGGEGA